ncbi:MAG: hypothetical protein HWQ43_15755 [Nostoc sp. JL31]|nr:hypothetical protein [Nostoc sp. JL31]MBN3890546.1 hypothetical protein [Nostoc sp. JL31]
MRANSIYACAEATHSILKSDRTKKKECVGVAIVDIASAVQQLQPSS